MGGCLWSSSELASNLHNSTLHNQLVSGLSEAERQRWTDKWGRGVLQCHVYKSTEHLIIIASCVCVCVCNFSFHSNVMCMCFVSWFREDLQCTDLNTEYEAVGYVTVPIKLYDVSMCNCQAKERSAFLAASLSDIFCFPDHAQVSVHHSISRKATCLQKWLQCLFSSEPNCTVSKTFENGDLKGDGERRPMPHNESVWCFLPCLTLLPNVVGEWRTGSRPGSCIASSFQHLLNVTAVNMLNHLSSLPVAAPCNSNLFGMSCG